MAQKKKSHTMTDHVTRFLELIDSQIAREMQRSPEEQKEHGVQKWEPYKKRVERIASHVIGEVGEQNVQLDSILVAAESFTRVLRILVEEFGEDGLGKIRSAYCREIFQQIERDVMLAKQSLEDEPLN